MTDRAEREVRKWALKRNGDPISNADIVELVFAFADDQDADHDHTLELIEMAKQERTVICRRITDLELWRQDSESNCEARMKRIAAEIHLPVHEDHLATHHNSDSDQHSDIMWNVGRWIGSKAVYIVLAILVTLINIVLNWLWFGQP